LLLKKGCAHFQGICLQPVPIEEFEALMKQ